MNDFLKSAKKALTCVTDKLDAVQDKTTSEMQKVHKSKIGRSITYALGGDPDADRVLGYEKHDLPEVDDSKLQKEMDEFFKD